MFMNKDKRGRKIILIFTALVILGFSIIFSVRFGSVNYTSGEILKSLFIKSYDDEILKAILWDIRIPRILIAVMVGCNLSLAGVLLQAVMKNDYIPTTLLTVFAVRIVNLLLIAELAVLDHQFVF